MDHARVAKAVAASRAGASLTSVLDNAPGTSHPMWAVDEVAYLNALQPAEGPTISMGRTALKHTAYTPPGPGCPFNLGAADTVASANAARSNAPLVRVLPGGA